jgi:hypothetical protein
MDELESALDIAFADAMRPHKIERKPCEYCNGESAIMCKDIGFTVRVHQEELHVEHDGNDGSWHYDDVPIHYCPMCGRKLEAKEQS